MAFSVHQQGAVFSVPKPRHRVREACLVQQASHLVAVFLVLLSRSLLAPVCLEIHSQNLGDCLAQLRPPRSLLLGDFLVGHHRRNRQEACLGQEIRLRANRGHRACLVEPHSHHLAVSLVGRPNHLPQEASLVGHRNHSRQEACLEQEILAQTNPGHRACSATRRNLHLEARFLGQSRRNLPEDPVCSLRHSQNLAASLDRLHNNRKHRLSSKVRVFLYSVTNQQHNLVKRPTLPFRVLRSMSRTSPRRRSLMPAAMS